MENSAENVDQAPESQNDVSGTNAADDNLIQVEGVLDIDKQKGGNGSLLDLKRFGKRRPSDVFVPKELIRRFKLRQGV